MSLIDISNLTFGYPGSGEHVLEGISSNRYSWKTGLIGRNGRGKTTLLRLLMGNYPYQGTILAPVPFVYFPCPAEELTASAEAEPALPEAILSDGSWNGNSNLLGWMRGTGPPIWYVERRRADQRCCWRPCFGWGAAIRPAGRFYQPPGSGRTGAVGCFLKRKKGFPAGIP